LSGNVQPTRTARETSTDPNGREEHGVDSNNDYQADQPAEDKSAARDGYSVEIDEISLYIKRRSLEVGLFNSIQKKFSQGKPAMYPVTRTVMSTAVIQAGTMHYTNPTLSSGMLPQLICIGIVSSNAYNGRLDKSPFNFKHNNASRIVITINGQPVLYTAPECNFKEKEYMLAYNTLFGEITARNGNGINMEDYLRGNTLYVFDFGMTEKKPLLGEAEGTMGVEITFSDPLEEHQNLVIMTESQSVIEINKFGLVTTVL